MNTWLHDLGQSWMMNAVIDTRRYVIFAVLTWAVLWVALKAPLQGRKIREASPPPRQMAVEFLISIRSILIFSTVGMVSSVAARHGIYPMSEMSSHWGPAWFIASLALMILGHDAYYYWVHRWMHQPRQFRTFHRRHHRSHNPSPFTAYSFDLREALMMVSFVLIWPLVVPTPWAVTPIFVLHQIFRNTLLHCGYELMPARRDGRPMFDWLTTTTHHDLHHAQAGSNFGLYFTWWDRWMGTENPGYHAAFARAAGRTVQMAAAAPAQ